MFSDLARWSTQQTNFTVGAKDANRSSGRQGSMSVQLRVGGFTRAMRPAAVPRTPIGPCIESANRLVEPPQRCPNSGRISRSWPEWVLGSQQSARSVFGRRSDSLRPVGSEVRRRGNEADETATSEEFASSRRRLRHRSNSGIYRAGIAIQSGQSRLELGDRANRNDEDFSVARRVRNNPTPGKTTGGRKRSFGLGENRSGTLIKFGSPESQTKQRVGVSESFGFRIGPRNARIKLRKMQPTRRT